jgi:putative phosphoesterase
MRILILSDSHSGMGFMRHCLKTLSPNAIIHLGDYYDDAETLHEEYPMIPLYQVPGNCDRYRCRPDVPEILIPRIGGVDIYMTHGHKHSVKSYMGALLRDARRVNVQLVLYGHTHIPDCHQEDDGLWVLNPGSCGYFGGSAGLVETKDGSICNCRLLEETDLVRSW